MALLLGRSDSYGTFAVKEATAMALLLGRSNSYGTFAAKEATAMAYCCGSVGRQTWLVPAACGHLLSVLRRLCIIKNARKV